MSHKNAGEKLRINRILKNDSAICAKTYPNAVTLAKKLEVTIRTILCDIEYLRNMYRAPIEYDYNKRVFTIPRKFFYQEFHFDRRRAGFSGPL
jgi:predicted DNA-binding transcriptional regulator YafY